MSALDYTIDLEDIRFVLYDQLKVVEDLAQIERYAEFDKDIYDGTLDEASRVATEVLAPINAVGDRVGCTLDVETGQITTPEGFKEAWDTIAEGGWISLTASPEVGGVGLPAAMHMAVTEMFTGAAMAFWMYAGLTGAAARVIAEHGPEHLRQPVAELMFTGKWGGTMCLTEAGAGSDVGENRARATPLEGEPGTYLLEGEKIFISSGDQDLTENVIHLVLARTPDSPPGTKGLSLFLVPKFRFDHGSRALGERNGAYVVGIEEKMGIHGSSTCTLELGGRAPCHGWLVGEEHEGIKIMFLMMNEARVGVGCQGVAMGSAAYHYALAYAKERTQGPKAESWKDPEAPRVAITEHPDVRRMLMSMKVQVEAMRSMLYRLGHRMDVAHHDPAQREKLMGRVDLLVPILKAHCSDLGFDIASTAVQVLGGYGYIGEYPVEQVLRDARICGIYEGTNGIQAMDLVGRKMQTRGGALFMEWMQDGFKECQLGSAAGFEAEADAITKAINQTGAAAMHLGGLGGQGNLSGVLLQAYPFLKLFGTVHLALESLNQARAAGVAIEARGETPHLAGKALNLKYYVANILPGAVALAKSVTASDESCMDERLFT